MQATLKDMETRMRAAVDLLTREFAGVRTGRANVALLDPIRVEAYGAVQPISQLGTPSAPDRLAPERWRDQETPRAAA